MQKVATSGRGRNCKRVCCVPLVGPLYVERSQPLVGAEIVRGYVSLVKPLYVDSTL